MSYMVMECYHSYAVLLDEEGRFLKAANLRYEVGETVYNPILMREDKPKTRHVMRWLMGSMAVAAACLLLIVGMGWYQSRMMPYSSICLSINPEVEIYLNKQGTVLGLIGVNEDGKILLKGYDGKGKDKVAVAEEIIDKAIDMGYLSEGGLVSFSIDTPEEKLLNEYGEQLRSGVKKHLEGRIMITIEINSPQTRQTVPRQPKKSPAKKNDSSTGDKPSAVKPSVPADTDHDTENGKASDYDDTDYGTDNDSVTDQKQPEQNQPEQNQQQAPSPSDNADSDYNENKQGDPSDSDYRNGNHNDNDDQNGSGDDDNHDDERNDDDDEEHNGSDDDDEEHNGGDEDDEEHNGDDDDYED